MWRTTVIFSHVEANTHSFHEEIVLLDKFYIKEWIKYFYEEFLMLFKYFNVLLSSK